MDDDQLIAEFVDEAREHFAGIESQLLQIEANGENIDDDLVNTVFRAIHSVKGAAGFLGLTVINNLSHAAENVLGTIRSHKLIPDPFNIDVILKSADRLRDLIEEIDTSNDQNVDELVSALDALLEGGSDVADNVEAKLDEMTEAVENVEQAPAAEAPAAEAPAAEAPAAEAPAAEAPAAEAPAAPAPAPPAAAAPPPPPAPAPPPAAAPPSSNTNKESKKSTTPEASIRVGVRVLDQLMNLAGELVLSRNQLLRCLGDSNRTQASLDSIATGLDHVTTELQENIMQTRMQPIGNVFQKFPRVIRDLSASLEKQVHLEMEGNEVEVDKTIVEAIADPLTHLVRNSVDHGVETPGVRIAAGKPAEGTVTLRAFHQAGKVLLEIVDDGAGMDADALKEKAVEKGVITKEQAFTLGKREALALIFAPGFSTAPKITDVSGRGVGMDVVRTNIEKLGGMVEIESTKGEGSVIRISLPLTLAIVPSMIVTSGGFRYALPQANIIELVRADGHEKRTEKVSGAEVLRLRGNLIPLVRMRSVLEQHGEHYEPEDEVTDCSAAEASDESSATEEPTAEKKEEEQITEQIVVVETGRMRFGLLVDQVNDSEEIVVKPLGRHLNNHPLFAGATILGDGRVAMILDIPGVASKATLSSGPDSDEIHTEEEEEGPTEEIQRFVLMAVHEEDHFAVSMDIVSRIEQVSTSQIDTVGGRKVLQYRGGTLPLLELQDVLTTREADPSDLVFAVVFQVFGHEVGLIAPKLYDIRNCSVNIDVESCTEKGIAGIAVIDGNTTRILDLYTICEEARPEWFTDRAVDEDGDDQVKRILISEDSTFFRTFLTNTLVDEAYEVVATEDGALGWEALQSKGPFDILVTDIEMPNMDGIELTARVRADARYEGFPVIALTSLADSESRKRGAEVGVDEYQVKMNKPVLLESIARLIKKARADKADKSKENSLAGGAR